MTPTPFRNAVTYPALFFGFTIGLVGWLASVGFGLIAYRYWFAQDGYYTTEGIMTSLNLLVIYTFLSFSGSIIWLNDAWNSERAAWLERQQAERQRTPRVMSARFMQERVIGRKIVISKGGLTPAYDADYATLYKRIRLHDWKVNRHTLTAKGDDGEHVFPGLSGRYGKIVAEWHRLGWIDGYVRGDTRKERYTLNEDGQRAFIDNAGVHLLGATSPTDD